MNNGNCLLSLRDRAERNAVDCILPFWTSDFIRDEENGGFFGRVTLDMERKNDEHRSLVLYGRLVYAFSNAYSFFKDDKCAESAKYSFDYLVTHFIDEVFGGAFSMIDSAGNVVNDEKPLYSEAFLVMACAAYYKASGLDSVRKLGLSTFDLIEKKARSAPGVYANALARDWRELPPDSGRMPLPSGAILFPHHLMQAYEQLYRVTGDKRISKSLHEMCDFIINKVYSKDEHCFVTAVDKDGARVKGFFGDHQSLGHDCELSYLALDVAELLGDAELLSKTREVCTDVLRHVLAIGFDSRNSLYNGYDIKTGAKDPSHVWWAQAEAVTAMLCAYELTGDDSFLEACDKQLFFIEQYFVNKKDGDWYNNIIVDDSGCHIVDGMHGFDKLNGGKCPFHNSHMCFEVIKRVDRLLEKQDRK